MYAKAEEKRKSKIQPVTTEGSKKHGSKSAFQFAANRPEAAVQRNMNKSLQLRQRETIPDTVNNNSALQLQTIKKIENNTGVLQLNKKHFPSRDENDPMVIKYKNTVAQVVGEIEKRVDQARGMALNWNQINFNDQGYLGLWARTARDYFNNPRKVPDFIHARFGYAIETIACSSLPSAYAGLSIDFQVAEGHTRPDIVLSHPTDGVVGWLDITSHDSANHILGKDGAGWRSKPFVYEIFYNALSLPEVLTGLVDPVYKAWGEYLSIKNQIVQEESEKKRTELRNKLLKLQEDNKWQTGIGNAAAKRNLTKGLLEELGMKLGRDSQKATRGALAVADISDGPYGYNAGEIGTNSRKAKEYIRDKAAPEIKERHAEVEKRYLEYYQDIVADHQDLPLVIAFYKYLLSKNIDRIEVGTAVAATVQQYDLLKEAETSLVGKSDKRAAMLLVEIRTWLQQLPQDMNFKLLQAWSNKAVALCKQQDILTQVIEEQYQFINYLRLKYGQQEFFFRTLQEHQIVNNLSQMQQNPDVVLFARQYRINHPLKAQ